MRFKAIIKIDLPGYVIYEKTGKLARFFGIFKKPTGEMRVLADTFTLLDQLINGFKSVGITNAIALKVDHKMLFNDTRDRKDDVDQMIAALDRNRYVINENFELLQIAMECRKNEIHYIFDTQVSGRTSSGKEEVCIAVSGKIGELDLKNGESSAEHRTRVKKLMDDDQFTGSYDLLFRHFLEDVLQKLKIYLDAISGRIEHLSTGIRPERKRHIRNSRVQETLPDNIAGFPSSATVIEKTIVKSGSETRTKKIFITKSSSQTIQGEKMLVELDDVSIEDSIPLKLLDDLIIDLGYEDHDLVKMISPSSKRKK
ncbi:hypothetical protein ACFL9U_13920 [Thermodesulfobacteriota bacterium]